MMTTRVIAVGPDDDLANLRDLLYRHRIRHMPVVDAAGELLGLVSHRDLLQTSLFDEDPAAGVPSRSVLARCRVSELMTTDLVTVEPESDLRVAAEIMLEKKLGCLPVVEDRRLVGILTEADFVRFLARGE
jgi:CBS domain-containing protein